MHKALRHIFTLIFLLVIGFKSMGQVRPVFRQPPALQNRVIRQQQAIRRVEQVKEKYISQRLNLTPEESTKFWPIYRRYQLEIAAVRIKKRLNNSSAQPDGAQQIQNELNFEGELVEIRKRYTSEFLQFLPAAKISELFKAEREFQDELIRQLRERQAANTNPPS
jgi:hypothetical protein